MSAPVITATVDIGDVETGLDAMERRARALGPVMKSLTKPLRDDQKNHKRAQSGPSGSWARRSEATIAAKHGKRKLPRTILGRLPTAVSYKTTPSSVTGTSRVRWSGAHQDGATVGHGARLPAREFLWISDEMMTLADNEIADAMVRAFGGSR